MTDMVDVICHQGNCVTTYTAGIAKSIFDRDAGKYPSTNCYNRTGFTRTAGKCDLVEAKEVRQTSDAHHKYVATLFGQRKPGGSKQD